MLKFFIFPFTFIFLNLFNSLVYAQDGLVINEIMVKPNSGENEWIELYNLSNNTIDLTNYYIDDDQTLVVDGSVQKGSADPGSDPKQLTGMIGPGQFNTVTFSNYFNDSGDSPTLFNLQGTQETKIDSYPYGDNPGTNITFGRLPDGTGGWQTNCNPTQGQANNCQIQSEATINPSPSASSAPTTSSSKSTVASKSPSPAIKSSPKVQSTSNLSSKNIQSQKVLGENIDASSQAVSQNLKILDSSPSASASVDTSTKSTKFAGILIGSGVILIGASIGLYLWYRKNQQIIQADKKEENF